MTMLAPSLAGSRPSTRLSALTPPAEAAMAMMSNEVDGRSACCSLPYPDKRPCSDVSVIMHSIGSEGVSDGQPGTGRDRGEPAPTGLPDLGAQAIRGGRDRCPDVQGHRG